MRNGLILGGLLLVLGAVAGLVAQKEWVMRSGTTVLLELAPRDPRSLMQGDYMMLSYALSNQAGQRWEVPRDGQLVVALDARSVATFVRWHGAEPLGPGEHLLRYRLREHWLRLGAEAFYFQEGQANLYAGARYGELRVMDSGDAVLVGLRDAGLNPLGTARPAW